MSGPLGNIKKEGVDTGVQTPNQPKTLFDIKAEEPQKKKIFLD